jgi:cytoskeletal protein RodZ
MDGKLTGLLEQELTDMTAFGASLKAEREQRGLSLDFISATTKVSQGHLQALEQDDFLVLPGGVFRKGIVRAYLATVGLDEAAWMQRFELSLAQIAPRGPDAERAERAAIERFANNVKRGRVSGLHPTGLRWFGVFVLFLGLALAAWTLWRWLHGDPWLPTHAMPPRLQP